jgi:septation ring formation regulator EzrA
MAIESFDEECLLKDINCSKLSAAITKLTFSWNNNSNPVKEAHELMDRYRKLSLEILEYEQRMGSKLSEIQRNKLDNSMEDLAKVIPYMENKIVPSEILKNTAD